MIKIDKFKEGVQTVKLTKLRDCDNPRHPNNIIAGSQRIGNAHYQPTVGERFWVNSFSTSLVQEILDDNTFRTYNSIYKWEIVDEDNN
jgi:hypothetical protein